MVDGIRIDCWFHSTVGSPPSASVPTPLHDGPPQKYITARVATQIRNLSEIPQKLTTTHTPPTLDIPWPLHLHLPNPSQVRPSWLLTVPSIPPPGYKTAQFNNFSSTKLEGWTSGNIDLGVNWCTWFVTLKTHLRWAVEARHFFSSFSPFASCLGGYQWISPHRLPTRASRSKWKLRNHGTTSSTPPCSTCSSSTFVRLVQLVSPLAVMFLNTGFMGWHDDARSSPRGHRTIQPGGKTW